MYEYKRLILVIKNDFEKVLDDLGHAFNVLHFYYFCIFNSTGFFVRIGIGLLKTGYDLDCEMENIEVFPHLY